MVVTREHGYELELDPERLDAHRFERLVAEGRRELAGDRPERAAAALEGALEALARGDGIARGEKLIALGEQIGDKERVFAGHDYRLHCFWMLGDRAGVEVELEALGMLADEVRQPSHRWHLGAARTALALMEGQFERAKRLIAEALALGQQAESWNALVSQRLALFVLRRAQGRLAELEDTVARRTSTRRCCGFTARWHISTPSSAARRMPARPSTACCHGTSARSTSTRSGSSA
jgi:hypothetical protein